MESQTELTNTETLHRPLRMLMVESLAQFRSEWQSLTAGQSLVDVESSVGLMLCDIADRLALSPQERFVVLGRELAEEVETFVNQSLDIEIVQ